MLEEFKGIIEENAARFQVPESWIRAVILAESFGDPLAYRAEPQINDASYGLMQVLYGTAKGLGYTGPAAGLYDPAVNVMLGTKLLGQLKARYGDDLAKVYSAYNSGSATAYLTNSTVRANVDRVLEFAGPVWGSAGILVFGVVLWYLMRGKAAA
jgi:soluble lytic murein transglycosylase-like protein